MNEPVKCRVTRVKTGLLGSSVQYIMTLQEDDVAILIARRHHRANGAATLHIHACDVPGGSIDGRRPVAKLHANFMGTEYSMVTEAEDHPNSTHECKTDLELGAVAFAPNVMGTKGPRRITAVVPKLVPAGDTAWELVPAAAPAGSLMARHRATAAGMNPAGGCVALRNRPPRWNDALGAYCLNFRGRVTQASVKNFQLIAEDDPDRVIVQFGRVGANTFTLDYAFPIGPLQAFATALAALDPKLGCE
jgi:tubby and related proteins